MTLRLCEVGDAYKQNEIYLTKDVTQLKDNLKVQTYKVEDLNKQLLELKKQKETVKSKCLELETTTAGLIQDVEQSQALNETLKLSLISCNVFLIIFYNSNETIELSYNRYVDLFMSYTNTSLITLKLGVRLVSFV